MTSNKSSDIYKLEILFSEIYFRYTEKGNIMQLVDRTLKTLTILSKYSEGLNLTELSGELQIPNSSTHRVLKSLKESGFVIQDIRTKRYQLSYKIISISQNIRRNDTLILHSRNEMVKLSKILEKNVILCVLNGDNVMNLECVEYANTSMFRLKKGYETPWFLTSAGRVIVSMMQQEEINTMIDNARLEPITEKSIVSKDILKNELSKAYSQGYYLLDEELQQNVQGVACPIYDYCNHVIGAIAFTTLKTSQPITKENIQLLLNCSRSITESLR